MDYPTTILAAALRQGIPHVHACGGKEHCSTCRVQVLNGLDHLPPRNAPEQSLATRLRLPSNMRLACQTAIEKGAVQVRRPVIAELASRPTNLAQQYPDQRLGEEAQCAVLFSDSEDYTVFAETVPAYDVIHVLNR